jgi:GTP-binding protein Era
MWLRRCSLRSLDHARMQIFRVRHFQLDSRKCKENPSEPDFEIDARVPDELRRMLEVQPQEGGEERDPGEDNVHINPKAHWRELSRADESRLCRPENKSLRVSFVGVANVGKSTLVNAIVGSPSCPYSRRDQTTRSMTKAIWTQGDTQVVFMDTPGLVSPELAAKYKLEEQLLASPGNAAEKADVMFVVQDVSSRYTREAIDKSVLRLLCRFSHIPSVLVLNKMDTIPKARRNYDLIRKLTGEHIDGVPAQPKVQKKEAEKQSVDAYLESKEKKSSSSSVKRGTTSEHMRSFYETVMTRERKHPWQDHELDELLQGKVGWPAFREVFAVSATTGDGLDVLRNYVLQCAVHRPWEFSDRLKTTTDPRSIVISTLKAKLLDVMDTSIPYNLNPTIDQWTTDGSHLQIVFNLPAKTAWVTTTLLSNRCAYLRAAGKLTEQDLMTLFECEVSVYLNVVPLHKVKEMSKKRPDRITEEHGGNIQYL